jgi:hypothetical protein
MRDGIVFNKLLLTITSRGIFIRRTDRRELPHLMILFKTASGEIDAHLKDELAAPGIDPYTSLFRFPVERLIELKAELVPPLAEELLKLYLSVRTIRPSWLRAKGYVLAISDSEEMTARFLNTAPKIGGRRRVDTKKLKAVFEDVSQITLLDPLALHSDELRDRHEPVTAVRNFGRNRTLGLIYAPLLNGHRAWLLVNPLVEALPTLIAETVPSQLRQSAQDVWYKIHDALKLDEVGISR